MLIEERLDHDISRLGQCLSTSKIEETYLCARTKRFLKQVWKRWMLEIRKIIVQVSVCTIELVQTASESIAQAGIQTMPT